MCIRDSRIVAHRRVHGEQRDHLQEMILHDVADRTDLLVEAAAAFDAEMLGHGDLHVLDVLTIPDRFQKRVAEAEIQQVLHRFLAEIVVDAED